MQRSTSIEKPNPESRLILGCDKFLTGLVLGYGDSTIEQVKRYTKLRGVSTEMKSIVDKHMTLRYQKKLSALVETFPRSTYTCIKVILQRKTIPSQNKRWDRWRIWHTEKISLVGSIWENGKCILLSTSVIPIFLIFGQIDENVQKCRMGFCELSGAGGRICTTHIVLYANMPKRPRNSKNGLQNNFTPWTIW